MAVRLVERLAQKFLALDRRNELFTPGKNNFAPNAVLSARDDRNRSKTSESATSDSRARRHLGVKFVIADHFATGFFDARRYFYARAPRRWR
jgi:hypothetical protein